MVTFGIPALLVASFEREHRDQLRASPPIVADFKTHISTSTMVGIAYGYWGVTDQGMSLESGILAGGLCSVAGMLPDLDSDSGIPLRETGMFAAAIVPMLMIDRFRDLGLSHEAMALAAMLIYIGIRFVLVEFFKRFTVHRGMWHSIPAALVAGLAAYLVMPCPSEAIRIYKSLAVLIGFMVHLVLDEIWSLDIRRGRVKKSFGTALKFFGNSWWGNVSVWGKLFILIYLAWGDHAILDRLRERVRMDRRELSFPSPSQVPSQANGWFQPTGGGATYEAPRQPRREGGWPVDASPSTPPVWGNRVASPHTASRR